MWLRDRVEAGDELAREHVEEKAEAEERAGAVAVARAEARKGALAKLMGRRRKGSDDPGGKDG